MAERIKYTYDTRQKDNPDVWDTVFGLDPAPEDWSGRILVYKPSGVPNPPIDNAVVRAKTESATKNSPPPDLYAGLPRGDKN